MRFRPTPHNVTLLLAGGFLGLALLGAPLLFGERTAELAAYLGLLLLFTAIVAALIFYRWLRRELDWFEPGVFVGLLYLAAFGYGGVRLLLQPELLHPFLQADPRWIPLALLFVVLGIGAFWAGYYLNLGLRLHQLFHRPGREQLRVAGVIRPFWVISLYAVGLAARLYMVRAGWYAYLMERESYFSSLASAQVLMLLELFCQYALVLALLDYFSRPHQLFRRLLAYTLLTSEIVWGFFSGMKYLVLLPVLYYLMVHTYKRGRLPVRYVLVALVGLVLLYPLNMVYRGLIIGGGLEIRGPVDMLSSPPVILRELAFTFDDPGVYLESGYQSTLTRTTTSIQNYALLLKYLDTTGAYWYGKDLILLPALVFVPRFLWPTKPLADKGYWYAVNVWGQDPHVYNSIAITFPGDLHLQFGLPSLLLGMFLFGVLLRFLYERYARPRSDYSLFFYLLLFYPLMPQQSDVAFTLAGTVKAFIILFVLSLVVFRFPRLVPAWGAGRDEQLASPSTVAPMR